MTAHETGDVVSVVIVTYQSRAHVDDAIASARGAIAAAGRSAEIIVVDNASADGTADHVAAGHPDVVLLRNDANVGFGRANDQAFAVATGSAWLLLNPDARLDQDALPPLLEVLETRPRAAAAAPHLDGPGTAESAGMLPGVRSALGHFLFLNRVPGLGRSGAWRGFQLRAQTGGPVQVEWASAAALLLRPDAVRAVGGFDERFFLYGEDTELGASLGRAGYERWLVPASSAWHAIAGSSETISTRWLDGLDEWLVAAGAGRGRRAAFQAIAAVGLLVRSALGRGDPVHRRRTRAGGRHAAHLAGRILRSGGRGA